MRRFIRALNYGPTIKGLFQIIILIICICIALCMRNISPDIPDIAYYIVISLTVVICLFVFLSDSLPSIKNGIRASDLHDAQEGYRVEE